LAIQPGELTRRRSAVLDALDRKDRIDALPQLGVFVVIGRAAACSASRPC